MILLILGLVLFLGVHSVSIVAETFRDRMVVKNEVLWKGLYTLISLIGIVLICKGYVLAQSSPVLIYAPPLWLRHAVLLLLAPVFILMLAPYFPGRIGQIVPHPQLLAVKIWAVAHLLANGFMADVILFSAFLLWAVLDRVSLKKRTPRTIPSVPNYRINDALLVVIGLGMYLLTVMWLHELLTGVSVIKSAQ